MSSFHPNFDMVLKKCTGMATVCILLGGESLEFMWLTNKYFADSYVGVDFNTE